MTEDRRSKLRNRSTEITQSEQEQKKNRKKNFKSLRDLWENIKRFIITGVTQGQARKIEHGIKINKIMTENLPNFMKNINLQIWEAQ